MTTPERSEHDDQALGNLGDTGLNHHSEDLSDSTSVLNEERYFLYADILYNCSLCKDRSTVLSSKEEFVKHIKNHHLTVVENENHPGTWDLGSQTDACLCDNTEFKNSKIVSIESKAIDSQCIIDGPEVVKHSFDSHFTPTNGQNVNNLSTTSSLHIRKSNDGTLNDLRNIHKREDGENVCEKTPENPYSCSSYFIKNDSKPNISGTLTTPLNPANVTARNEIQPGKSQRPRQAKDSDESLKHLKELTEQIRTASSCAGQIDPTGCQNKGFITSPCFTKGFGKYTTLIREGGNIAYFCQACNWKSSSHPDFQKHCSSTSHRTRVKVLNVPSDNAAMGPLPNIKTDSISCVPTNVNFHFSDINNVHKPAPSYISAFRRVNADFIGPLNLISSDVKSEQNACSENAGTVLTHPTLSKNVDPITPDKAGELETKSTANQPTMKNIPLAKEKSRNRRKRPSPQKLQNQREEADSSDGCSEDETLNTFSKRGRLQQEVKVKQSADSSDEEYTQTLDRSGFNSTRVVACDCNAKQIMPTKRSILTGKYRSRLCSDICLKLCTIEENVFNTSIPLSSVSPLSNVPCEKRKFGENLTKRTAVEEVDGAKLHGEGWKISRIKSVLSDFIFHSPDGNVARDILLLKIRYVLNIPDAVNWGPACNRAVREKFPCSTTQRKGKYKNFFAGFMYCLFSAPLEGCLVYGLY